MVKDIRTRQERWKAFWGRRSRVGKITLVLLGTIFLCTFGLMVRVATTLDTILITICSMAITPLLLILLFRWFTYKVLWRVRNRLILTYLLMGLAPLVMFATLAAIAGYLLAGQYATNMGISRLNEGITRVRDQAGTAAIFGGAARTWKAERWLQLRRVLPQRAIQPKWEYGRNGRYGRKGRYTDFADGVEAETRGCRWRGLAAKDNVGPLTSGPPPAWLHPGFQGIVEQGGNLYLCAEVGAPAQWAAGDGAGQPAVDADRSRTACRKGWGGFCCRRHSAIWRRMRTRTRRHERRPIRIPMRTGATGSEAGWFAVHTALERGCSEKFGRLAISSTSVSSAPMASAGACVEESSGMVFGGAPGDVVGDWHKEQAMIAVISRPSYLYALLFASSVKVGKVVWAMLIGIAAFFALMELFALAMATSLSLTITRSVAELYKGTKAFDAGHLEHRIPVKRKDQLAALANIVSTGWRRR